MMILAISFSMIYLGLLLQCHLRGIEMRSWVEVIIAPIFVIGLMAKEVFEDLIFFFSLALLPFGAIALFSLLFQPFDF